MELRNYWMFLNGMWIFLNRRGTLGMLLNRKKNVSVIQKNQNVIEKNKNVVDRMLMLLNEWDC